MLARHIAGSLILAAALTCYSCHSVDPNETAKLQGPNLYRIMGRPPAAIPGFAYSDAIRARARRGVVPDATTLEGYIADPESVVAGTTMSAPQLPETGEWPAR